MRRAFFPLLLILPTLAVADDRIDTLSRCFSAYAAGDRAQFERSRADVEAWQVSEDPNISMIMAACLALSGADLVVATEQPATPKEVTETIKTYRAYLDRIKLDPLQVEQIAADIAGTELPPAPRSDESAALQDAIRAYVRPIPARRVQANLTAYTALSRLDPENPTYAQKVTQYETAQAAEEAREAARQKEIVRKLVKTTAEFDGSAWYRHPSSPRYQDITSYVTLYVLETGAGKRALEFFVNYTSRDGWLFVQSASINVDGEITRLPATRWYRDNDTEIWEWAGYEDNDAMIALARAIATSDRAVIRFNGQQFYDDHVISAKEKRVIADMLLAWDEMR